MNFAMVGINYKNASLSIREKAVFTDTKKMEMYVMLEARGISESVILSTCNRSEIYFLCQDEGQLETVKNLFLTFFEQAELADVLVVRTAREALTYLFEVSNGLHSLVLGEDQIAGQVVKSEEFARVNGQSRKLMNHIFRSVIACTKKAKTLYRISEHPLSLSYVAVSTLKDLCGIKGRTALIIGSGKMSTLALQYLLDAEIDHVYLANRTMKKAEDLSAQYPDGEGKLIPVEFKDRYAYLSQVDIVISATSSPHAILRKDQMPELDHDIYMIDMASPRDIDEELHDADGIHVYDMDALEKIIANNHQIRKEKVSDIQALIQEEVDLEIKWLRGVKVDHTIRTLQERIEDVSEETYEMLLRKLTLSEHDKYVLRKSLKTSMQRLMQDPIVTLKKEENTAKQEEYHTVVKELFHLEK